MSDVRVELATRSIERVQSDLVVIPLFTNERPLRDAAARADWRLCGRLSMLLEARRCDGRRGEAILVPSTGGLRAPLVMGLGLGDRGDLDLGGWSRWVRNALERAADLAARRVGLAMPECIPSPAECLEELVAVAAAAAPAEIVLVPEPPEWRATADWLRRAARRDLTGVSVRPPAEESRPRGGEGYSTTRLSSPGSAGRFSR